ncbi:phosphodiester glycosidase family protein [Myroides fluvii]|uniref:phosphodiester glycosidase family protein n=1 Tax=Myroides fluvii TaxID=2572594 RepID=UPI00131DBE1B|nr:phosphodiester glycosidase family protein [Myroides fluvii]
MTRFNTKTPGLLFLCMLFMVVSCKSGIKGESSILLKEEARWTRQQIVDDLVLYSWVGHYYEPYDSYQTIRVLALPKKSKTLRLELFDILPEDSLSQAVTIDSSIVAAINGTYFEKGLTRGSSTAYLKINTILIDSVEVDAAHQFGWKHEGALAFTKDQMKIIRGNNQVYGKAKEENIISGSPILIEEGKPVGAHFVKSPTRDLHQLHYENPERHQGVRHPRTAIALTEKEVLLITVDGRSSVAAGMSAKELTEFIQTYFPVQEALNIDGGGSTTMWIATTKVPQVNGVVNYPSDNRKQDHLGQRLLRNALVVKKIN